jgi:hypothetical protein
MVLINLLQTVLAVGFLGALVVAYREPLLRIVRNILPEAPNKSVPVEYPPPIKSVAVELVDDILAVTKLRDRLAAEDYKEGVDACTVLLRVIVEHNYSTYKPSEDVTI